MNEQHYSDSDLHRPLHLCDAERYAPTERDDRFRPGSVHAGDDA